MKRRNLVDSFNDAIAGLFHAFKTERNMRIHFFIAFLVLFAAVFYRLSKVEIILLFVAITFVLVAEMVNTALENIIDMVQQDYHPLARIAKNVSAGGVLISALNALVIGYILFYDKIDKPTLLLINRVKALPVHITAASLLAVIIAVIIIKNTNKTGSFLRGGMPSGHSALAFALFTCITLISGNALMSTLSFIMALMVLHSRYETKVHTIKEVIIGAILGIVFTVMVFQIAKI
ncbi:MAG: phosphatase PAP2 family protein [Clostridiales bacterium]|nr:phosphatase PAP2 family protein [Clostridiales bacterium]